MKVDNMYRPQHKPWLTLAYRSTGRGMVALLLLLCGLGVLVGLAGCGDRSATAKNGKPTVVATIFCYYDALRAIGGDNINAVLLLPVNTSPHEYSASISDKSTVQKAQLIVRNGLGIDPWIDKLAAGNNGAVMLDISKAVPVHLLQTEEVSWNEGTEGGGEGAGTAPTTAGASAHRHTHEATAHAESSVGNPHIWLDPTVQMAAAEQIRDALSKLDPTNRAYYQEHTAEYLASLKVLDAEFMAVCKTLPRKEFIGFHSAYDYLAHRYGLRQIAALEEFPEQGITTAQAGRVIKLIKEKEIKVIFTETVLRSKDTDLIVAQTGVKLAILQPLETYDNLQDTYVSLMRQNLANLKQALSE